MQIFRIIEISKSPPLLRGWQHFGAKCQKPPCNLNLEDAGMLRSDDEGPKLWAGPCCLPQNPGPFPTVHPEAHVQSPPQSPNCLQQAASTLQIAALESRALVSGAPAWLYGSSGCTHMVHGGERVRTMDPVSWL